MIYQKKSPLNVKIILITGCLIVIPLYSKAEDWLWKIEKQEYSMTTFARDYKSYIRLMALQMGITAETLIEYINKKDAILDPRMKSVIEQLRPTEFGENFILLSLLKMHANENKYFEDKETLALQKFIGEYIIAQLYLNELISKMPVVIKDEELEKEWVAERDKNENYKTIPIEQGLAFMRQKLTAERKETLRKEFIKSLFDRYKIEKNQNYQNMLSNFRGEFK